MQATQIALLLMTVAVSMSSGHPPGVLVHHGLHAPYSSDTKVIRDGLGNQATSYAYQDGHSSAVSLSRTDVDNHLVPVAEPVVAYHHPPPVLAYTGHGGQGLYHHGVPAPAVYHGHGIGPGPVGPAIYHQAPAGYHHGPGVFNHGYGYGAGAGFGPAAYNNYF